MQLKRSTYEVLQILSISLTDKTHLRDLFDKTIFNVRMAQAQSIGTRLQADEIRLKAEAALHSGFNELQQLGRAMSVYDQPLMTQTLELLKESVKGGELSVTDYFVEADQIYRNLQAYMELECQYQKVAATLYKNRL